MKLSIIIPVYNSEKYVAQCLESVLGQDLDSSEYEVIVINDGSTDISKTIILAYQQKHSNLILIEQENQGVSAARNAGLNIGQGEYIIFVDADDLLFPNCVLEAYLYASSNDLDLLYGKINYIDADGQLTGEFVMNSDEIKIEDGFNHQRRGYIVGLYKKESLGNLRFTPDVPIAEDALFNLLVHARAKRISYFNQSFYKYRRTPDSSLNSDNAKSEKAFHGFMTIIDEICKYLAEEEKSLTVSQYQYFNWPIFITSKMALEANIIPAFSEDRYDELVKRIEILDNKTVIQNLKNSFPLYGRNWPIFIGYHLFIKYKNALKWKLFRSQ